MENSGRWCGAFSMKYGRWGKIGQSSSSCVGATRIANMSAKSLSWRATPPSRNAPGGSYVWFKRETSAWCACADVTVDCCSCRRKRLATPDSRRTIVINRFMSFRIWSRVSVRTLGSDDVMGSLKVGIGLDTAADHFSNQTPKSSTRSRI